ncbi:alpha/beta hydrolase [Vibrio paucivorans]
MKMLDVASKCVRQCVLLSLSALLVACSSAPDSPMYQSSPSIAEYQQPSFGLYVSETREWLKDNRVFHGDDKEKELAAVMPYELIPDNPNGEGVLLVHGLGDSPYSFSDIAQSFYNQGYRVRVLLLPGHGTRPADLMLPELSDWNGIVDHHVALFETKVDKLWLGGFSTGTNLVTTHAAQNPSISGLILFSPAFVSKDPLVKYATFASKFIDWADRDTELNYSRYDSLAMHGAGLYYQSTQELAETLETETIDVPAILMMSEADELISSKAVYDLFHSSFTHPNSQLIWYGEKQYADERFVLFPMNRPDLYIHTGSHISPLYREVNPLYGKDGEMRRCGKVNEEDEFSTIVCPEMNNVWHSAWGLLYREDAVGARLSWNPYFDETMARVFEVMGSSAQRSEAKTATKE